MEGTFEDIIRYFSDLGYQEDDIKNEIDAITIGKKNITPEILKNKLSQSLKTYKPNKSKNIEEKNISGKVTSIQTSSYSNSPNLDDKLIKNLPLDINFNETDCKYFLEDQDLIDASLSTHFDLVKSTYISTYQIPISPINDSIESDVWTIGRIQLDEDADQDEYIITTETEKYKLNFSELEQFMIYPGQTVLAEGRVESHTFKLKTLEIRSLGNFEVACVPHQKLKIALLSGPFTGPELDYNLFFQTLSHLSNEVNVIIIVGPLVDCENEAIKKCQISVPLLSKNDCTYEDLLDAILNYISGLKVKTIIVPHIRETTHLFPLPMPNLNRSCQTKVLSTCCPGFLSINGLVLHVVPYDVIYELVQSINMKTNVMMNKIQFALDQLIQQKSYLPVFPNTLAVEYSKFIEFTPKNIPNILIVNSKLAVKNDAINGITCVKQNFFYDGKNTGNYSIITSVKTSEHEISVKQYRAEVN